MRIVYKELELLESLKLTVERLQKLEKVEDAIREYHFALNSRKHGGVAQDVALNRIMDVLDMHWHQIDNIKKTDHSWELP